MPADCAAHLAMVMTAWPPRWLLRQPSQKCREQWGNSRKYKAPAMAVETSAPSATSACRKGRKYKAPAMAVETARQRILFGPDASQVQGPCDGY